MRYWLALLPFILQVILPIAVTPQNTAGVTFNNSNPVVLFGSKVTFKVQLSTTQAIQKIYLYIEPQSRPGDFYPMTMQEDGTAGFELDLLKSPLRVFSSVSYHYRVSFVDGSEVNSPAYSLEYTDNRFQWKKLESETFVVNWYDGDIAFGQLALNTAVSGLQAANKILPVKLTSRVNIFIYASSQDLQGTRLGLPAWVAGHTAPDMRQILVSIPPGLSQKLELERQLPHELTHILQYETYGEHSRDFPTWLLEGSASGAELYPNPEFANVLQTSVQQNQLLPIEMLCSEFPRDASGAFLAYAQSQSFVRFLTQKFGASGMRSLFNQYRDGMGCEEGVQAAFGSSLPELEYQWRLKALGVNPAALIVQSLIPYMIFLLLILGAASITVFFYSSRRRASGLT